MFIYLFLRFFGYCQKYLLLFSQTLDSIGVPGVFCSPPLFMRFFISVRSSCNLLRCLSRHFTKRIKYAILALSTGGLPRFLSPSRHPCNSLQAYFIRFVKCFDSKSFHIFFDATFLFLLFSKLLILYQYRHISVCSRAPSCLNCPHKPILYRNFSLLCCRMHQQLWISHCLQSPALVLKYYARLDFVGLLFTVAFSFDFNLYAVLFNVIGVIISYYSIFSYV